MWPAHIVTFYRTSRQLERRLQSKSASLVAGSNQRQNRTAHLPNVSCKPTMVGTSQLLYTAQQSDSAKTSPFPNTIYVLQGNKERTYSY